MSDAGDIAHTIAQQLAVLGEAIAPIQEAVEGYRVARVAEGYPDELARRMATDYHAALIKVLVR